MSDNEEISPSNLETGGSINSNEENNVIPGDNGHAAESPAVKSSEISEIEKDSLEVPDDDDNDKNFTVDDMDEFANDPLFAPVTEDDILLSIPSFANEENKALNRKLLMKNRELAKLQAETVDHEERVNFMKEHLKNTGLEVAESNRLLESRNKALASEIHLTQLAERNVSRMKNDFANIEKDTSVYQQQLVVVQSQIHAANEKVEAFRASHNWKAEELERWSALARDNEENLLTLESYTRADEQRVRDLTRELESLTVQTASRRKELDEAIAEAQMRQVELEKCALEFRTLQAAREQTLSQWQDTVGVCQRRDRDIARVAERYASLKQELEARQQSVREREMEISAIETDVRILDSRADAMQQAISSAYATLDTWRRRTEALRVSVDNSELDVASAVEDNLRLRREIEEREAEAERREAQLEPLQRQLQLAQEQLQRARAAESDAGKLYKEGRAHLAAEEARLAQMEREAVAAEQAEFKGRDTVRKLREQEQQLQFELEALQKSRFFANEALTQVNLRLTAQKEAVYASEFQLQQVKGKINRANGVISVDERAQLTARIAEAVAELEELKVLERTVVAEAKAARKRLAATQRRATEADKSLDGLQARIDELQLGARLLQERQAELQREKEAQTVRLDVLREEMQRLRAQLSARAGETAAQESQIAQLSLVAEALRRELEAQRTLKQAELKLATEELRRVMHERGQLTLRANAAAARAQVAQQRTLALLGPGASLMDAEAARVHALVSAARRKNDLLSEAATLEQQTQQAEAEAAALARTVAYLNDRNAQLRGALGAVSADDDGVGRIRALEAELSRAKVRLFDARRGKERAGIDADQWQRRAEALQAAAAEVAAAALAQQTLQQQLSQQLEAKREEVDKLRADLQGVLQELKPAPAHSAALANTATEEVAQLVLSGLGTLLASPELLETVGLTDISRKEVDAPDREAEISRVRAVAEQKLKSLGFKVPRRPPPRIPPIAAADLLPDPLPVAMRTDLRYIPSVPTAPPASITTSITSSVVSGAGTEVADARRGSVSSVQSGRSSVYRSYSGEKDVENRDADPFNSSKLALKSTFVSTVRPGTSHSIKSTVSAKPGARPPLKSAGKKEKKGDQKFDFGLTGVALN